MKHYDTENELRIVLKKTLKLDGMDFYHEDCPKKEQIISATQMENGDIHIVLFKDKITKEFI